MQKRVKKRRKRKTRWKCCDESTGVWASQLESRVLAAAASNHKAKQLFVINVGKRTRPNSPPTPSSPRDEPPVLSSWGNSFLSLWEEKSKVNVSQLLTCGRRRIRRGNLYMLPLKNGTLLRMANDYPLDRMRNARLLGDQNLSYFVRTLIRNWTFVRSRKSSVRYYCMLFRERRSTSRMCEDPSSCSKRVPRTHTCGIDANEEIPRARFPKKTAWTRNKKKKKDEKR